MSQNAFVTSSAIDCDIIGRMLIKLVRYRVIVWRSAFISSFMDVEPCNKQNNVCSLMIICLYPHLSVILVFISFAASQLQKQTPKWPSHECIDSSPLESTHYYIFTFQAIQWPVNWENAWNTITYITSPPWLAVKEILPQCKCNICENHLTTWKILLDK